MKLSINNFENDLLQSLKVEQIFKDVFESNGWAVLTNDTYAYDMAVITNFKNNRTHLVEIKDESNYIHSGNICIETNIGKDNKKENSGIFKSDANIYIHYFGQENCSVIYKKITMTNWIIFNLIDKKIQIISFKNGDNNVMGIIINKEILKTIPDVYFIKPKEIINSKIWFE